MRLRLLSHHGDTEAQTGHGTLLSQALRCPHRSLPTWRPQSHANSHHQPLPAPVPRQVEQLPVPKHLDFVGGAEYDLYMGDEHSKELERGVNGVALPEHKAERGTGAGKLNEAAREEARMLLSALDDIVGSITGEPPGRILEGDLDALLERIASLMDAKVCTLRVYDEKTRLLVLRAAYGVGPSYHEKPALRVGEGIAGVVFEKGQPLAVTDIETDNRYVYRRYAAEQGVRSLMSSPIMVRNRPAGTLTVYYSRPHVFEPEQSHFFMILINVLGLATQAKEAYGRLAQHYIQTVRAFVHALEEKHPYTLGHSERVGEYAVKIGEELGLPGHQVRMLRTMGQLHDLGKLVVDLSILDKVTTLTREDFGQLARHPSAGAAIVAPLADFRQLAPAVRAHHERLDGTGYPDGISADRIGVFTRIIAVADAYDAMTSARPYRGAYTPERAAQELKFGSGSQFCPKVVSALLAVIAREQASATAEP